MTAGSGGGVEYVIRDQPQYLYRPGFYIAPGFGGGVIEIVAAGVVTVDGAIRADGFKGLVSGCAGSAGGSVAIRCAAIEGTGVISADGAVGAHSNGGDYGSGGAGGGICVTAKRFGGGGGICVTAKRFGGGGALLANGGNGGTDNRTGGGGGGRILVARVTDRDNTVTTSVKGGLDSETPVVYPGEDGTVVWQWLPPAGTVLILR